ncbi:MAG: PEGA domain-containing protein [Bacteroidia bacterium]|nr:PEGA domain-containing protein [Bacteroidia bacterium]
MKQKKFLINILIIAVVPLFILSACATIFTGTSDTITFNSNPDGAVIFINGVEQCKTPCTLDVKRTLLRKDVEFKLDGYTTRVITLSKEFNIVSILNFFDVFGWGIDIISGAVVKYNQKHYDITLNSNLKSAFANPAKINIDTEKKIAEIYIIEQ